MPSNILYLPFRRAHSVSLSSAIRTYISAKYDQHPDMFARDLDEVEKLRSDAIHVLEPHVSGIEKLTAYAAQLVWMGGKFPVDIGVDFVWYPALGYNLETPVAQNNVRFELANVLFNLAALYSQLAYSQNRSTTDGLKVACNYFCLSAGVLSHLQKEVIPAMGVSPPEDMDEGTLESVKQLSFAQAQECFWQKAVMDGFKDASIAKLAAKVSDYYSTAGEWGTKSVAISSEWIHHMVAKHHHFAAAAQYRAACDCLEKRKYGEEVARLRDSAVCVSEAMREKKWINGIVLSDLQGLKEKVQDDLKRAEKDNDMIYLLPVPPKPELKTLDRANMAVAKIPSEVSEPLPALDDHGKFGPPLFQKLVPYAVHLAASIYVERRDRLVNESIVGEFNALTARMHDFLQSLNLPGAIQALEKPLGLPPSIISHAEEIRQSDGAGRIRRTMDNINTLRMNDKQAFQEGSEILRNETAQDEQARMRHGTDRWSRIPSSQAAHKLFARRDEIDGYLKSAQNSDDLVQSQLSQSSNLINLLASSDRDIEDFIPSSRRGAVAPRVEREVSRLRASLNEATRLEGKRRRKIDGIRDSAKSDDIHPELLREVSRLEREFPMQAIEAAQFEHLFDQRLLRYDRHRASVADEEEEQTQLLERIKEANSAFVAARSGDSSSREREQALQKLDNAFFKYKEILSNLDMGRKFYNELAGMVTRFRDECASFAKQRRFEAEHLESDITNALSALSLGQHPSHGISQQGPMFSQSQRPQQPPAPQQQPMIAPIPTRAGNKQVPSLSHPPNQQPPPASSHPAPVGGMWSPEMGIKFAPSNSSTQPPLNSANPQQDNTRNGYDTRDGKWDPSSGIRFG